MTSGRPACSGKRIAVALPSLLPFGGVERIRTAMIREFLARGHAVDLVLAHEPTDARPFIPEGTRLFELSAPRLRSAVRPFARYLREEKPDAVLVALWPFTSLCLIAHRLARSKASIVVSDHNSLSIQYRDRGPGVRAALAASLAMTYPLASGRVCVSRGVRDDIVALSHTSPASFTVIHNPITLSTAGGADATSVHWDGLTGHRIISVGWLKAQKNHGLLIRAFAKLLASADASLVIAGTGELAEPLMALARAEGVGAKVRLLGHIPDPAALYRSADLFVLSSDYEGFGNVIVEALAFGCPVVSTDCPSGPAEILENGRWGRLTPVGDADALAAAMLETLQAPPDRDALKRRAEDFSPTKAADRYLDLLLPDAAHRRLSAEPRERSLTS